MTDLQIRDLTEEFGSEIIGLDPEAALADPELRRRLQELFDERGVLVFRDLDVDQATQANLIRMLIGLDRLPKGDTGAVRPTGEPFYVSNKEPEGGAPFGRLLWHADMMWSDDTFRVLSLYGIQVDEGASPTLFTSAAAGWDTLPDDLKARVEGLTAVQGHNEGYRAKADDDPDVLVSTFDNEQTRTTDVGYTHPHSGRTVLYVSQQMTSNIAELEHAESEALLEQLFDHLYRDEVVYEHHWRQHDLVAWDNVAIQHARPNVVLDGPTRTLRKVFAPIPPRSSASGRPTYATSGQS